MAKNQFQDPDLHTPAHDAFIKAPQPEYGPQGGLF